jgi:hypothetical protein
VWTGLAAWVSAQLEKGRAVNVPHFFKMQFQTTAGARPMSNSSRRSASPRRSAEGLGSPVFVLADDFISEYRLVFKAALRPGASIATGVPTVDLQYSAVSQVCGVDKDTCQHLLKTLIHQIGLMMGRGSLVEVQLPGTGIISSANKCVSLIPSSFPVSGAGGGTTPRRGTPRGTPITGARPPQSPRNANSPRYGSGVRAPREVGEIALSVTPAPSISRASSRAASVASAAARETDRSIAVPGAGNDSAAAANAMIFRPTGVAGGGSPRRLRGAGLQVTYTPRDGAVVPSMNELGSKRERVAYPKFLMPERGAYVDPSPRKCQEQATAAGAIAYERYKAQLDAGVEQTTNQLHAIDTRWKEALKTDALKEQLMKEKAGEVNAYLMKQMLEKQARHEAERTRKLVTPDVYARTGYPPINSPSRCVTVRGTDGRTGGRTGGQDDIPVGRTSHRPPPAIDERATAAAEALIDRWLWLWLCCAGWRHHLTCRDLRAKEVEGYQKRAQAEALHEQIRTKQAMARYSWEREAREELLKLQAMARQLEAERATQRRNEELTRGSLKQVSDVLMIANPRDHPCEG